MFWNRIVLTSLSLFLWTTIAVHGQVSQQPAETYTPTTTVRPLMALTYPEGPTLSVKMQGTYRLPRASGEAKIERRRGTTEIEIEVDEMKPAHLFGGDYNTYVLWVVTPEGHVDNVGEFVLRGNRSKLNVSTSHSTFGLFITAEPHFLVDLPSRFVVMENSRPTRNIGLTGVSEIQYRGFDGIYQFENESLANEREVRGEVRSEVQSARTSIELARRAGAEEFAAEELSRAQDAMREAEAATGRTNRMLAGQRVVRLAFEAQKLAEERSFQAALAAEREANAARIEGLANDIAAANDAAERARLLADQRRLEAEMEARVRREAQERAEAARVAEERARIEAEEARRARERAEEERAEAARMADKAERMAEMADRDRLRAEEERRLAQEKLEAALSQVADVRDSARGLIVSLPDILFDFGKDVLKPDARERLAKMAGILLVLGADYRLSIEGHTDSIGSDEFNLRLSERRAESVNRFLLEQGVASDIIVSVQGFGEARPVASNDNDANRSKNRRVEIVFADRDAGSRDQW